MARGSEKGKKDKKRASKIQTFDGFVKQMPRAFNYLLQGAFTVQIEAEDDVSVLNNNGEIVIVEQLKTKKRTNVFADSAIDLWETIYNWVFNYTNEPEKTKYNNTKFILYSTKKNSILGSCLKKLLSMGNEENFDEVMEFCEKKLINSADEIKKYLTYIKDNKEIAYKVIKNFTVQVPQDTMTTDLDNLIIQVYKDIYTVAFDDFINILNGWFYRQVANREGELLDKCAVTQADFETFKANYNGRLTKIKYKQGILTQEEIAKLENKLFVEQLNKIDLETDLILIAKKSYIDWKNCEEKDLLSGRVSQDVLNNTYSNLKDNWNNAKSVIPKNIYSNNADQGKYLYNKVQENSIYVDGVDLQGDKKAIARGAYNYLANQNVVDEYSVGWHPDYVKIFENWSRND